MFSLVGQTYRPLNIILLLQRFSSEEVELTRSVLQPFFTLPGGPTLSLHNFEQAEPKDARTHLLNLGLSLATGRYLAFLDYDDVLFPEAYTLLTDCLRNGGAAIAFASVLLMRTHVYKKFIYTEGAVISVPFSGQGLLDLFRQNFCPLHSYVMDRHKISPKLLHYDTTFTIEEDYDFLLRLCAHHMSDFSMINTAIGYYFYKTDGSNTVAVDIHDSELKENYQQVCTQIENRRRTTYISPAVQQGLHIQEPGKKLTIRDLLEMNKIHDFNKK